jgi:excinuclease ABC subunit A
VLYVLDEPSIGLHQRDNARLLDTLKHLRDIGNTVIVVEHDEDAILHRRLCRRHRPRRRHPWRPGDRRRARPPRSWPTRNPSPANICPANWRSRPPPSAQRARRASAIKVVGRARQQSEKRLAEIPLGTFTCVTGVSGGGKSTFLIETLFKAASRRIMGSREHPAEHDRIEGLEFLDKVIDIDQSPIGRTPRSNPATYTGAFTPIRDWFAGLPEAKARGYQPGRFSFNVKGGRCEACQGDGVIKIEMHFLPDVYVTCDVCHGKRYNRETLDVLFKGKSIADVLDMTVEEGVDFFAAVPGVRDKLQTLSDVGLGYIHVGQQATTLSGGEAQRIKLAKELSKPRHRQDALHPRRADHRPAFPRRCQASRSAARTGRPGQHGGGHRAQSRSHQNRRLGARPRPRRRRRRRRTGRLGHAGRHRGGKAQLHRAVSEGAAGKKAGDEE